MSDTPDTKRLTEIRDEILNGGIMPRTTLSNFSDKRFLVAVIDERDARIAELTAGGLVYYRCSKCGTVAAPHQIEPDDIFEPLDDCECWKTPNWVRGTWRPDGSPSPVEGGE